MKATRPLSLPLRQLIRIQFHNVVAGILGTRAYYRRGGKRPGGRPASAGGAVGTVRSESALARQVLCYRLSVQQYLSHKMG